MPVVRELILGSTSPFRKELLEALALPFQAAKPQADEKSVSGETPNEVAAARARLKAESLASDYPEALIIGGDQVLALDGISFDKAETAAAAKERLQQLVAKEHTLHSALALVYSDSEGKAHLAAADEQVARLMMRSLSEEEIDAYVATGEWQGSVGCYKLEKRGVGLFDHIDGDSSTIIGLPLVLLTRMFFDLGVNYLTQPKGPWEITLPSS